MFAIIIRALFIIFCIVIGCYFSAGFSSFLQLNILGGFWGLVWATAILLLEWGFKKTPPKGLIAGSVGLLIGLILANLITTTVLSFPFSSLYISCFKSGYRLGFGLPGDDGCVAEKRRV